MIVLASQSPRRAELLRNAGISFRVQPAHIPEEIQPGEPPSRYVQRLARQKAEAVFEQIGRNELVLGADTTVVADEHVLEKPRDGHDTARMLRLLSGRAHQVMTGVCLIDPAQPECSDVRVETTEVRFASLSEEEIADYVASGEAMDKAGAYGIQGIASRWIAGLNGDYFNVVGLPVPLVYRMLREHGVKLG